MSVETAHRHDVESASTPTSTASSISWLYLSCLSKSSLSNFVSYVGVRGVAVIVLLKVITVIAFALFLMGGSPSSRDGDFSGVTLVSGRPENLRERIHEASRRALAVFGQQKALFTMHTHNDLVYDNYIEVSLFFKSNIVNFLSTLTSILFIRCVIHLSTFEQIVHRLLPHQPGKERRNNREKQRCRYRKRRRKWRCLVS